MFACILWHCNVLTTVNDKKHEKRANCMIIQLKENGKIIMLCACMMHVGDGILFVCFLLVCLFVCCFNDSPEGTCETSF